MTMIAQPDIIHAFCPAGANGLHGCLRTPTIPCTQQVYYKNTWFTPDNVQYAFAQWSKELDALPLIRFANQYAYTLDAKKVGIIMAGNIPMVGLHDMLCTLLAGHHAVLKLSSDDEELMKAVINKLTELYPPLAERIHIAERLNGLDAVIATGSNNTSRYFDYYFRDIPHIIRKNRNSIAVLTGSESDEELLKLGEDIFRYFGLGCRNVTALLMPKGMTIPAFYEAIQPLWEVVNHNKYANNYNYHKAILLLNMSPHLDNGFLLTREDSQIYSPTGILNYQFYENPDELKKIYQRS